MFDEGLMARLMAWRSAVLCAMGMVMRCVFWIGEWFVERRGRPWFWGYKYIHVRYRLGNPCTWSWEGKLERESDVG
jgi:hypothetical protein